MTPVFADTVFFLALLNEKDEYHEKARTLLNALRRPIVTTAWVFTELADGLADTPGRILFQPFVTRFAADDRAEVVRADQELLERGIELYHARPDKEWSLTDCVSFLVMHQKGITEALTADHHFEQAGFKILLK